MSSWSYSATMVYSAVTGSYSLRENTPFLLGDCGYGLSSSGFSFQMTW